MGPRSIYLPILLKFRVLDAYLFWLKICQRVPSLPVNFGEIYFSGVCHLVGCRIKWFPSCLPVYFGKINLSGVYHLVGYRSQWVPSLPVLVKFSQFSGGFPISSWLWKLQWVPSIFEFGRPFIAQIWWLCLCCKGCLCIILYSGAPGYE